MKICMIYDFLTELGGLEREMLNHYKILKEEGYDIEILSCYIDLEAMKKVGFKDVKVSNISTIKTKSELLSLILCFLGFNKLNDYNPDAFISYSFPSNFLIRNKKCKKINYINHFPHFLYLSSKEKIEWASGTKGFKRWAITLISWPFQTFIKKLDKRLVKENDLVFMNSKFTKKRLDKIYGCKDSIVSYVPVDGIFKPSNVKINEKYIFSSGRIIPDKKYEWLVLAVSKMKNKLPVYISGQGNEDYIKILQGLAKKNKVELKFLGRLSSEDLVSYYTNASVFAFPTPGEDFGLVPAESMSCGTPVVIWGDGAGPTEQVVDGVTGFHAKPYDLKEFALKLDKIIDGNMKTKNKKKIIAQGNKFSAEEVKNGFLKEVERVLG